MSQSINQPLVDASLSEERLKYLLHYNPNTGVFTWNVNKSFLAKKGQKAGFHENHGK